MRPLPLAAVDTLLVAGTALRRRALCLVLALVFALLVVHPPCMALAADGDPDLSFDGDGKLVPVPRSGFDAIYDLARQPDGKLVAVGERDASFVLARYLADGQLDAGFGTGGLVTVQVPGPLWAHSAGTIRGRNGERMALVVQPDGKLIIGGSVQSAAPDFGLLRFNSDGTPDTTFGTNGIVITNIVFGLFESNHLRDLALQPDGKILAVGGGGVGGGNGGLARYNADGTLDMSFGAGGIVETSGNAIALQTDGKILLAAGENTYLLTTLAFFQGGWAVRRFNADGTDDASFGDNGVASTIFFPDREAFARDILVQPDGKIVMAGAAFTTDPGNPKACALARYNTDGSPDTGFDGDGKLTTAAGGYSEIDRIALQTNGALVAAGGNHLHTGSDDFLVLRYQANGTLDPGFGSGGLVSTDFFGRRDEANGVVLQTDGKIVAAGLASSHSTGRDFALTRYLTDGGLDASFGTGGKVTTALISPGNASFEAVLLQPDGKILAGDSVGGSFLLARYNADGSPDLSFGSGGHTTTEFDNVLPTAVGVNSDTLLDAAHLVTIALLPDGRIIAGGSQGDFGNFIYDKYFLLARYHADGSLDTTFSADGLVEELINASNFQNFREGLKDLVVQPDGRVVITGIQRLGADDSFSLLQRYNQDGTKDTGFFDFTPDIAIFSLRLLADGKVLGVGPNGVDAGGAFGSDFAVARFRQDGRLDSTFASGGIVTTDFGGIDVANSVIIQSDGKFVAAGASGADIALARYHPDGTPDAGFGSGGKTIVNFGGTEQARSVAALANGSLLVGGIPDFLLARLSANGTPDASFGTAGRVTNVFPGGTLNDLAVQSDGKIVAAGLPGLARYQGGAGPAPTPTATPSGACTYATTTGTQAIVPGTALVPESNTALGEVLFIALPFEYEFYGQLFSAVTLGRNGNLQFSSAAAPFGNTCSLPNISFDNAIFAYWDTLNLNIPGGGIFTSVSGAAPNRTFNVEWRGETTVGNHPVNFEVRLYEGQQKLDVIYNNSAGANGASATLGVQQGTGNGGNALTQFACNSGVLSANQRVTYELSGCTPTAPPALCSETVVSYTGPAVAIPDNSAAGINIPLQVSGVPGTIADVDFRIDAAPGGTCDATAGDVDAGIDHSYTGFVVLDLTSPAGTKVRLKNATGAADGNNICQTTLDDDQGNLKIQFFLGQPVAGSFRPSNPLSAFDGQNPNGTWTLNVIDANTNNTGNLRRFSLRIAAACAPTPTPTPTGSTPTPGGAATPTLTAPATPTITPTRTPAPEACYDCIDNDFDGAVDRRDLDDCVPPADGGGAGLGADVKRGKAALKCQKALAKVGAKLRGATLKNLGGCVSAAFTCVQLKPGDAACLAKAGAKCGAAGAKRATLEGSAGSAIAKACGDPQLALAELAGVTGLGFDAEADACARFAVPALVSAADVATCLVRTQACRAANLLGYEIPRARELLALVGRDPDADAPCLPAGADGDGLARSANVKAVAGCQKALAKATAKFAATTAKHLRKCADTIAACLQAKPSDAKCLQKGQATCGKQLAKLTAAGKGAEAKLAAAITKTCTTKGLTSADLLASSGVGFDGHAAECAALGGPPLSSAASIAECIISGHECRVQQSLTIETPRLHELLELGGFVLD